MIKIALHDQSAKILPHYKQKENKCSILISLGLTSLPIIQYTEQVLPLIHSLIYGTKICTAFWLRRIWGTAPSIQN